MSLGTASPNPQSPPSTLAPTPVLQDPADGERHMLRRFLQSAAHELRTPVTTLKGTAQLARRRLARGDVDPQRLDRSLEIIDAEADRLSRLINQLLEAAQIANGGIELADTAVDLGTLVTSVLGDLPLSLARTSIEFRAPAEPAIVDGDPEHLLLAVCALIENAARYAPGEPLLVDLASVADGGAPARSMVALSVVTPMPGVPRADLGLIVDRVQAEQYALSAGAGVGLLLCRQIVEMHGGRIETAPAEHGRGTRMTALLPARRPAEAAFPVSL